MCLLSYFPTGQQPRLSLLANGAEVNEDGHGFAIIGDGELIVGKGLDAAHVIDWFGDLRSRYPAGPALFHSRMTTHGEITKDNCHPFQVGNDPRTVIAHNGIMPMLAHPKKGDLRSDTRIVAEVLLPKGKVGNIRNAKGRKYFGRWMTSYNKVVILTVDPTYSASSYVINEKAGEWFDGAWYSNDGYLGWGRYARRYSAGSGGWYVAGQHAEGYTGTTFGGTTGRPYTALDCNVCWTRGSMDPIARVCKWCWCCQDCEQDTSTTPSDCRCFVFDDPAVDHDPEFTRIMNMTDAEWAAHVASATRITDDANPS